MLPVAPLPFDNFRHAQIEGVLISVKVFEKSVHLWAFYSGLQLRSSCVWHSCELHWENTNGQQSLMMMILLSDSVRVLAFISRNNIQVFPGGSSVWCVGLRPTSMLGLRVRILPGAWMFVSLECCVGKESSATGWSLVQGSRTECDQV
jgi:hypothetical protein